MARRRTAREARAHVRAHVHDPSSAVHDIEYQRATPKRPHRRYAICGSHAQTRGEAHL